MPTSLSARTLTDVMDSEPDLQTATPDTAEPAPSEKSKKPPIIGLITAGTLALALAVVGTLTAAGASARADEAAEQYLSAVERHIDAINDANDERRAEVITASAELTDVTFGEQLSEPYRDARDVEREYEALIADATPVVQQRHAASDLRAFLGDLSDIFSETISLNSIGITDQASLDDTRATAAAMTARVEAFSAQSVRVQSWVYPEQFQGDQTEAAVALELMAETWHDVATTTEQYIAEWDEYLRASDGDDTAADDERPSSSLMTIEGVSVLASEYRVRTRSMTDAVERLVAGVFNSDFADELETKAVELQGRFDQLQSAIAALRAR